MKRTVVNRLIRIAISKRTRLIKAAQQRLQASATLGPTHRSAAASTAWSAGPSAARRRRLPAAPRGSPRRPRARGRRLRRTRLSAIIIAEIESIAGWTSMAR
jgi:hypothetical protein